jgi:hypothetical protein
VRRVTERKPSAGGGGNYNVERLIAAHGADVTADWHRSASFSVYDRCRAVYDGRGLDGDARAKNRQAKAG